MREFAEFYELNGVAAKVIIKHRLFGKDTYKVDRLQIINDDERIGVVIHMHELFMYKQSVKRYNIIGNTYTVSDDRIEIYVTKL